MPEFLGIDTSNYTTSVAVYFSEENRVEQCKKLLPVREGERGLRQSDAVFHHTKQLPEMISNLAGKTGKLPFCAVSSSVRPRNADGSYMPCFLCGEGFAQSFSALQGISFYRTSHQTGHILAALFSAGKLSYTERPFIAFHVSGGTTDCLFCRPDEENIIDISEICTSLDLNAGQAVDRVGIMLGLRFPCGAELEKLAEKADRHYRIKPTLKDGSCCLSGLENKCRAMIERGETPENTAAFCLDSIAETVISMTEYAIEKCGNISIVYAGGVMSDRLIKNRIVSVFGDAVFAAPEFSCDNAAGVAIYGYLKYKK